jgi:hypothetical protein
MATPFQGYVEWLAAQVDQTTKQEMIEAAPQLAPKRGKKK